VQPAATRLATSRNRWLMPSARTKSMDFISKLPSKYDARGHGAKARIIEGEIDEMEKQIFVNHREDAGGAWSTKTGWSAAAVRQRDRWAITIGRLGKPGHRPFALIARSAVD
jgi:hypothetical protein